MKFEIITLVDITETRAKFDKNDFKWHQQQNFITVLSTIGLRVNPVIRTAPSISTEPVATLGLGSKYKGSQKVWRLRVEIEQEDAHSIDKLQSDFNLVPVISSLDETVKFQDPVFETINAATKNIVFKCYD